VFKNVERRSQFSRVVEYLRELGEKSAAPSAVHRQKTRRALPAGQDQTPVPTGLHKPAARSVFISNHP